MIKIKTLKILLISSTMMTLLTAFSSMSYADSYQVEIGKRILKGAKTISEITEEPQNEEPVLADWVYSENPCGGSGLRRSNVNPSVYYIRSKYSKYSLIDFNNIIKNPEISFPKGFRRITLREYRDLIPIDNNRIEKIYNAVCDESTTKSMLYDINNQGQMWFYLADNYALSPSYIEGNKWLSGQTTSANSYFAGFVLIKEQN